MLRAITALFFGLATLATLTHWIALNGRVEADAAKLPALSAVGTKPLGARPGSARLMPFERLVAPFQVVPSGSDEEGRGYVRLTHRDVPFRETLDLDAWRAATDAVFLDGDRIGGDGVLAYLPPGVSLAGAPLTIEYRSRVTQSGVGFLWAGFAIAILAAIVSRRLAVAPPQRRSVLVAAFALAAVGVGLTALNVAGLFVPKRPAAPMVVFPGAEAARSQAWLDFETLERELQPRASESRGDYAMRMNALVGDNMMHAWNYANVAALRLHVPPWSNYLLWAIGELDPTLYRYHYIAWRPALARGAGMCAQVTLVLVDLLRERGYDARIVQLDGHTVVTAEVAPGTWHVFDPDVGVVLPKSLEAIERDPESVRAPYEATYRALRHDDPNYAANLMVGFYGREGNHVEPRGGNEMMGTRWVQRERAFGILKWLIPTALLALAALLVVRARRLKGKA